MRRNIPRSVVYSLQQERPQFMRMLRELLASGICITHIAEAAGMDHSNVSHALERHGEDIRSEWNPKWTLAHAIITLHALYCERDQVRVHHAPSSTATALNFVQA